MKHCGPVTRIALIDGRQSGLVEFETEGAAEQAIKLKGTKLTEANFDFTVHPEATTNTIDKGRSDASRTVYIPCFPAGIDIVPFFEKRCGPVQQCCTKITACAYGFVEFESLSSVEKALNSMAGQEFPELGNSALKIRPAKTSIQHFSDENPSPSKAFIAAPTSLPPPVGSKSTHRAAPPSAHRPASSATVLPLDNRRPQYLQSSPALCRTIHVAPLRPTLTEETLCAVFQEICGPVVRGFLVDGRQSGLVEFTRPDAAAEALKLKGVQFKDGHLTFTLHPEPTTNTIGPRTGPRPSIHTHRTIYIPCFPANMDLAAFFQEHCGDVSRTQSSITACAYGFVEFQDGGSAEKALGLMGAVEDRLGGDPLKVTRAKTSIEDKAARPLTAIEGARPAAREPPQLRRPAPPPDAATKLVPISSSSSSSISSCTSVGTASSQGKPSPKNTAATGKGEGKGPHHTTAAAVEGGAPKTAAAAAGPADEWQTQVSKWRQRQKHLAEAAPASPPNGRPEEHGGKPKPGPAAKPKPKPPAEVVLPKKPHDPGKPAGLPGASSSSSATSPALPPAAPIPSAAAAPSSAKGSASATPVTSEPQGPETTPSTSVSSSRVDPSPPIGPLPLDFGKPAQPVASTDALSSTWIYNLFQIVGSGPDGAGGATSPEAATAAIAPPPPQRDTAEHLLSSSVPTEQVQVHHVPPPPFIVNGTGANAEVPGIIGSAVHQPQSNFSFLGTSFFHTPSSTFGGFGTEVGGGPSYLFANSLGSPGVFESRMPLGMDVLGAPSPMAVAPAFPMGYSMRTASTPLADDVWIGAQSMASAFGGAY
eukprot:EG_transcript_2326